MIQKEMGSNLQRSYLCGYDTLNKHEYFWKEV